MVTGYSHVPSSKEFTQRGMFSLGKQPTYLPFLTLLLQWSIITWPALRGLGKSAGRGVCVSPEDWEVGFLSHCAMIMAIT